MMVPWTRSEHVSMHWRPDAITSTSVIQPMWIRQLSPVDMATHTIDPFITSVRGRGPAVSPYPSPEDVAYAAGKLGQLFARGQSGVVCMGTEKIKVNPNQPPCGGIVGTIVQAAQELARGGTVKVTIGPRAVIVCNSGPGGEPAVAAAPAVAPAAAAAPSAPAEVSVRPTPMSTDQQKNGFGQAMPPPLLAHTRLPNIPRPGNVPQNPFLDYAYYYRKLNYDDNVWARRNFQASIASRFAPQPVVAMNAATSVPIHDADASARVPLDTRAPMVQKMFPRPEAVFPHQARVYNVRGEQR